MRDPSPIRIEAISHPTLLIAFSDSSLRRFSVESLLVYPFFEPLKNPHLFAQARIAHRTITWPGDIDIAPETLWMDSVSVAAAQAQ
jgi:Protein of unknown function (DUF2442)